MTDFIERFREVWALLWGVPVEQVIITMHGDCAIPTRSRDLTFTVLDFFEVWRDGPFATHPPLWMLAAPECAHAMTNRGLVPAFQMFSLERLN